MKIVEKFRAQADSTVAKGQKAYMRDQFEFIGLKTPVRWALQKDFLKAKVAEKVLDWDLVQELWSLPEREFQYLAVDYLKKMKKLLTVEDLPRIRELAVEKSWWDTVDSLDELVGAILLSDLSALTEILNWSLDENFWVRRLAIDCQLGFKEQTNRDLLAQVIGNNLAGSEFDQEFFINKAIGWILRDFSKTDADWVRGFIKENENKMSKLSIREARKYL